MPICIECRNPVSSLYTTYSKADDRTLGKGVRLTQCPRCKRFADKYVEHDFVVLFIDLVLIKPQVYRHLLFNRLGREDDRLDPSIVRLGILLLLFDVYLTWARIERAVTTNLLSADGDVQAEHGNGNGLANQPLILQYMFFLFLCSTCTLAFHLPIRFLTTLPKAAPAGTADALATRACVDEPTTSHASHRSTLYSLLRSLIPYYPNPNRTSTALLLSSFTKLFPILMVIWAYDLPSSASAVSWAVIVNNIAALEILLDCGYLNAGLLAGVGAICRAGMGWAILWIVGLDAGPGGFFGGDGVSRESGGGSAGIWGFV